jgi:hypothetical protein
MSNSIAVQSLTPSFDQTAGNEENMITQAPAPKPALKVVPPQNTEPPTLEMLTALYAAQQRECWLCEGISRKIADGKEISEDDNWHFTSCVLSWEYLHRNSD